MKLPFNLFKWIEENKDTLKPPVGNAVLFDGEFKIMVVGGPNQRADYHIDEGEEFFFQIKGDMLLKTVQDGKFVDVPIKEGEVFVLPPRVPHSPQRFDNTIGLVVERARKPGELDGLRWYCEKCQSVVHEEWFQCEDLRDQLKNVIQGYFASEEKRTCPNCKHINSKK